MTSVELRNKLSAKFDFEQWIGILREMFPKVEIFSHINQVSHTLVKSGGQVGSIRLDDGRSLAIYTFEVSDKVLINRNRKGLRDIAAQTIDQSIIHGVLAFYHSKDVADYRLTYIAKQSSFNENGELIKSETAPKDILSYWERTNRAEQLPTVCMNLSQKRKKVPSIWLM